MKNKQHPPPPKKKANKHKNTQKNCSLKHYLSGGTVTFQVTAEDLRVRIFTFFPLPQCINSEGKKSPCVSRGTLQCQKKENEVSYAETSTSPGLHCPQGTLPLHRLKGTQTAQPSLWPAIPTDLLPTSTSSTTMYSEPCKTL